MRPLAIHRAFAELSLSVGHGTSTGGRRPRSTLLAGARGEALVAFAELSGGVRDL
jgi:hypothetical protein